MNKVKPLKNCTIETNEEYSYFKFTKVDEGIRSKDNNGENFLGMFNKFRITSIYSPSCFGVSNMIYIFGLNKKQDNEIVYCYKDVILALEEVGCKINIKEDIL